MNISAQEYRKQKRRITQRPEEELQKAVAQFLDTALPENAFWFHVPNQRGTRSKTENQILKAMGVKPGVPDCVVIFRGEAEFIELKPEIYRNRKHGGRSDNQLICHADIALAGAVVHTCYTVQEVHDVLTDWIPLRARIVQ